MGGDVFASENGERIVCCTCKSKLCTSCGQRANDQWQRELRAELRDVPYSGTTFTMPDVFWQLFHDNPHLRADLPVLAASVLEQWLRMRCGVRPIIAVIPHNFGRHLSLSCHLHVLVSAGGVQLASGRWISCPIVKQPVMQLWRSALIAFLRNALERGLLIAQTPAPELEQMLHQQEKRWWSVHVQHFRDKAGFLRYAGRYVKHPPIAERRILEVTNEEVVFWTNDLKLKRRVVERLSLEGFVLRLADQVQERYSHSVRYFGLLAPRSRHLMAGVFALLGQERGTRPRRLGWAFSVKLLSGVDPLLDETGQRMPWVKHLPPVAM